MKVAEVAAIALTGDALSYGTFGLCALGMVNRVELVAIISATIGHTIEAGESHFDEWAQAAQIPDGLRENLRVMYEDYDQYGFSGGNVIVLRTLLGREPRSLQQYFQELARPKVE